MTQPKAVAAIIYDGVNALDVAGPIQALVTARYPDDTPVYDIRFWSLDAAVVTSSSGLRLSADGTVSDALRADLLLICGGKGIREAKRLSRAADWLRRNHGSFRRIASVCTGAYVLAESGLCDGRQLTTHWRFSEDLGRRYPKVSVKADALFLSDGPIHSSGGVTAGIDLALALIAGDAGSKAAAAVAREMVVFLRRPGSQAQFSEPLKLQSRAPDGLEEACLWAANNLSADLSVEALAFRSNLSSRQFSRRFKAAFDASPAHYVKRLRLDTARGRLLEPGRTVEQVAIACGFRSPDGFRRAFESVYHVNPSDFQKRFGQDLNTHEPT